MKKLFTLVLLLNFTYLFAAPATKIFINGQPLDIDLHYLKMDDEHFVPATAFLKRLDITPIWDNKLPNRNSLSIKHLDLKITLESKRDLIKVNDKLEQISASPFLRNKDLYIPLKDVCKHLRIQYQQDEQTNNIYLYYYDELDYGIYFYGKGLNCQKYVKGQENPYFDPSKPTILYAHGWQVGSVGALYREQCVLEHEDTKIQSQEQWIEDGWNVGVFYWIQMADELGVWTAESKINTLDGEYMRWKRSDGSYEEKDTPKKSVAKLYADLYEQAFDENYTGNEIRITGNSLGGQLTVQTTMELHERKAKNMPKRMALFDPFWSAPVVQRYKKKKGYRWTGSVSTLAVKQLIDEHDMAIEYYHTSLLTSGTLPKTLTRLVAYQSMKFKYTRSIAKKHTNSAWHYFWSKQFDPPPVKDSKMKRKHKHDVALSATTPTEVVKERMGCGAYYKHKKGKRTCNPSDDRFKERHIRKRKMRKSKAYLESFE